MIQQNHKLNHKTDLQGKAADIFCKDLKTILLILTNMGIIKQVAGNAVCKVQMNKKTQPPLPTKLLRILMKK